MSEQHEDSGEDRRGAVRLPVNRRVIVDVGAQRIEAESVDISERGIAVATTYRPPTGLVRVAMELDGQPVVLRGRVVRHKLLGDRMLWGIEFGDLIERSQTRVHSWVSKQTGKHQSVA